MRPIYRGLQRVAAALATVALPVPASDPERFAVAARRVS
jgi:hypothetical protein